VPGDARLHLDAGIFLRHSREPGRAGLDRTTAQSDRGGGGSIAAYGADNQVSGWAYDGSGNVTGIPAASGSTVRAACANNVMPGVAMMRTACYDAENRMVSETDASGNTATYAYDGYGRRVSKTVGGVTTTFVYDPNGELAQEYGGPAPCASDTQYLTTDQLGSTRLLTNADGTVAATYDYLPFGEEFTPSADCNPIRFTSKERDAETGLDFFGARYFSAAQGRFTTPDWSAKPQPVPYADLSNPQTLNLYAYVRNNPLRYTDPDGHVCVFGIGNTCNDVPPPPSPKPPTLSTQQVLEQSRQPRTLSTSGVTFLAKHEGYSGTVYKDQAGNPTIGYGHLIKKGEDFGKGITTEQGQTLLQQDAQSAEQAVNKSVKVWVPQNQFDALTSFTFNVGGGALAGSTLVKNINGVKDVTEANFTVFNKAGGEVSPGLTNRRKDEYVLFEGH
jgi:RHS repeat-associated protein